MKTILSALLGLVLLGTQWGAPLADPFTPREAAEYLEKATVTINQGYKLLCSGAKVGPGMFLTAAHCVIGGDLRVAKGLNTVWAKSVLFPISKKQTPEGKKQRDWAILYTHDDLDGVESLEFACHEELYLGQQVAYMGIPWPLKKVFVTGYIGSIGATENRVAQADLIADIPASGGSSGAAVISMDTGRIIGVLTEVVYGDRNNIFMTGIENIANTDKCMAAAKDKQNAEKAMKEDPSR